MRCLDSTFLIDLLKGEAASAAKLKALEASGEGLSIAAPALTEILIGAYFKGGAALKETLELVSRVEVLVEDEQVAAEAGRMGAELLHRGLALPTVDLLIAAAAKLHQHILITRDEDFSRIPGLVVETY